MTLGVGPSNHCHPSHLSFCVIPLSRWLCLQRHRFLIASCPFDPTHEYTKCSRKRPCGFFQKFVKHVCQPFRSTLTFCLQNTRQTSRPFASPLLLTLRTPCGLCHISSITPQNCFGNILDVLPHTPRLISLVVNERH